MPTAATGTGDSISLAMLLVIAAIFWVVVLTAMFLLTQRQRDARAREPTPEPESSRMVAFAARVGWTYEPTSRQVPLPNRFPAVVEKVMEMGGAHWPTPHDVLRGTRWGHDVVVYRYGAAESSRSRGSGDQEVASLVVAAVRTPVALPFLFVGLRGLEQEGVVVAAVGEIDLENEDFNRTFVVACADRKLAYDVLNPRAMERLMAAPTQFMTSGGHLLATIPGSFDVAALEAGMDTVIAVVDHVPAFVWSDLQRAQGSGSAPPNA